MGPRSSLPLVHPSRLSEVGAIIDVEFAADPQHLLPPLRDRFKLICPLQPYSEADLTTILRQRIRQLGWMVADDCLAPIAARSFGTPRLAIRLLESVHRTARARGETAIVPDHLDQTFALEEVDECGLPARRSLSAYLGSRPAAQTERLLLGERGPLTTRGVRAIFSKYSAIAGVRVHPHLLRHCFGREFLSANQNDLVALAALMGHESLDTTRRYVQRTTEQLEAGTANALDVWKKKLAAALKGVGVESPTPEQTVNVLREMAVFSEEELQRSVSCLSAETVTSA